jgi:hypothetical protein
VASFFNGYVASLSDMVFSQNTASSDGGAIYEDHTGLQGTPPALSKTGSRITGNANGAARRNRQLTLTRRAEDCN